MKNTLHYELRVTQSCCNKAVLRELSATGLFPGQPKVLEFLGEHDGCEQKEIARGCDLEPATVTGILGRMEKAGLILREQRAGNRRSLYVLLTEKGQEALAQVEHTFCAVDEAAWRGIDEQEQENFMRMLAKIYQNLSEERQVE